MSNDDSKTEKPGLISRLWGWLFGDSNGDKTKGLKESKESDIDRRIRYNDRNVRVLCWMVAALLGFGATRDISESNISLVLNFSYHEASLNDYAQLIQVSWDAIIALASFVIALGTALLTVLMLIRGMCLNRKAKSIETNNMISRINTVVAQAKKKINNAEVKAKQANARAYQAEERGKEAVKRAETAEGKIKEANDRADNALMIAVHAKIAEVLTLQRMDEFKDEVVLTRKENHLLMADLAIAQEEIKKVRADAAKLSEELEKLKIKFNLPM